jgi:O-antigen/teichoic acid export membrane protein
MMRWQVATLAFTFTVRIFSYMLQAHQQMYLINYMDTARLIAGFFVLWGFFHAGYGVLSLVWTNMLSALAGAVVLFAYCCRLGLFPSPGTWGHVSGRQFRELFAYGKDLFLVGVGAQLILASQRMIISRRLGLEAVTMWGIGTRMFSLVSQVIWRAFDVSCPALAEMMVRGERELLRDRYRSLVIATASLAGAAAIGYALCNHPFVTIWTHHRVDWPSSNDVLMAVWLIFMTVVHCHNCFVLLTKRTRAMPYVFFAEGLVFVVCAFLTIRWGGFPAMIVCSMVCSGAFSGGYGIWRVSDYFKLPIRQVALGWLAPMGRVAVLLAPAALALWWSLRGVADPFVRLAAGVLLTALPGTYLFLRFGLSRAIQRELLERMPKAVNPVLRRIFPVSAL